MLGGAAAGHGSLIQLKGTVCQFDKIISYALLYLIMQLESEFFLSSYRKKKVPNRGVGGGVPRHILHWRPQKMKMPVGIIENM